jgi:hypothetical protein
MLVLEKMSMPGWTFKSNYIEHIFWLLDQCVCSSCKMTKQEYISHEGEYEVDEDLEEDVNPFTFTEFKPETYDQWSMQEKIDWLLGTACGCEYDFYDEGEGSGLTFVKIDLDSES